MMAASNEEVKRYAHALGVRIWELADHLGIGETTLIRRLRKPIPEETAKYYRDKIEEVAREKENRNRAAAGGRA